MPNVHELNEQVFGHWEASSVQTFLPGCRNCGSKHPLAMKPVPIDISHCPMCFFPQVEVQGYTVGNAKVTRGGFSLWGLLAGLLLRLGNWLAKLAERLEDGN